MPSSLSKSTSSSGTALTISALVPSVNFNGTITPRVVNERIRCPPALKPSVILPSSTLEPPDEPARSNTNQVMRPRSASLDPGRGPSKPSRLDTPDACACACPGSSSRFLHERLRRLFAVNSTGNAHVIGRMLKQKHIDDLRIGPDGLVSDFNDVPDQLRLAGFRKAGRDMTLNIGHIPSDLL